MVSPKVFKNKHVREAMDASKEFLFILSAILAGGLIASLLIALTAML